jgi:hypothetical protein
MRSRPERDGHYGGSYRYAGDVVEVADPAAPAGGSMRVRATRDGYYGGAFRHAGDVFDIADPSHRGGWMEEVDPAEIPLRSGGAGHATDIPAADAGRPPPREQDRRPTGDQEVI